MTQEKLQIDERAIITYIDGDTDFKSYLLHNGLGVGTVFYKNYSPGYSGLISITVNGKMLSLRRSVFQSIEWVKI